jgi:membrane protein
LSLIRVALTSVLFSVGKFLIGLYLGQEQRCGRLQRGGSVVTILLWVYYSALIFFFGAEITQIYAKEYGSGIRPTHLAEQTQNTGRSPS